MRAQRSTCHNAKASRIFKQAHTRKPRGRIPSWPGKLFTITSPITRAAAASTSTEAGAEVDHKPARKLVLVLAQPPVVFVFEKQPTLFRHDSHMCLSRNTQDVGSSWRNVACITAVAMLTCNLHRSVFTMLLPDVSAHHLLTLKDVVGL